MESRIYICYDHKKQGLRPVHQLRAMQIGNADGKEVN